MSAHHGSALQGLSTNQPEFDEPGHAHHPTNKQYINIAVILTLITIAEVAIYYIEGVRDILVPALVIMATVKFIMVVGYFMHLKFDDRRFTVLFATGLLLSVAVITALVIMQHTSGSYFPDAPPMVAPAEAH